LNFLIITNLSLSLHFVMNRIVFYNCLIINELHIEIQMKKGFIFVETAEIKEFGNFYIRLSV